MKNEINTRVQRDVWGFLNATKVSERKLCSGLYILFIGNPYPKHFFISNF